MSTGELTRGRDASSPEPPAPPFDPGPGRRKPDRSLRFRRLRALILLVAVVSMIWGSVRLVGWLASSAESAGQAVASQAASQPAASQPAASQPAASQPAASQPAASKGATSQPAPSQAAPTKAAATLAPPITSKSASAALGDAVAARTHGIRGSTAIGTLDLDSGVTATYQPSKTFATASIVKVDILATLLLKQDGRLTSSQKGIAQRMIQYSDNNAATALWNQIGGAAGLSAGNKKLGLTETTPGSYGAWGLTTTTVSDQLKLLSAVFTDESPLTTDARHYMRTLMGSVSSEQDWGVSAADDKGGSRPYLKNGWLPRSNGWIINSIGEVEHDGHPVLIVALSDGRSSESYGISVLEKLSSSAAKATTGSS